MASRLKVLFLILLISLIPTLLIWIPFFFRLESFWGIPLPKNGMETIVSNYDGPLYMVVAKTLYKPELVGNFSFLLPAEYYAAHFPLFPLLIKIFAVIFGLPYSMLLVTLVSSILAIYFFYLLISDSVGKNNALWITSVFSIFPARWLIVRSVGSAEPLFLAMIIASVYYFRKKNYIIAGIYGLLAQFTKSPGVLLFIAYFFVLFIPDFKKMATITSHKILGGIELKKYLSIFLIPLGLLLVFLLYKVQFNDFLAYFHSGDNIHLFFPPFQIFNYSAPWVGTFWLEAIIFVYLFGLMGLSALIKKKEFRLIFLILVIPIYLFSLAYISQNVMPVSDWTPLL